MSNVTDLKVRKAAINKQIGATARALREALGLSQQGAADRMAAVGYSVQASQIAKLERGDNEWHMLQLAAVCEAYDLAPEALFLSPQEQALLVLVRSQGPAGALTWLRLQE